MRYLTGVVYGNVPSLQLSIQRKVRSVGSRRRKYAKIWRKNLKGERRNCQWWLHFFAGTNLVFWPRSHVARLKKKLGRVSLFWGSFFYIHSALWRIQLELICLLFTSPCREICSVSKILHSRRFAIPSPHPRLIVDWNLCLQHVLIVSTLFVYHGFIFFSLMIASVQTFFSFLP